MRLTAASLSAFVVVALCAVGARAQDARQRQAAAEAYDRGTAAYLDGDHAEAAQWFETANRMAPAAPALMQAIRAHQKAGNLPRTATLALRLEQDYGQEAAAQRYAQTILSEVAGMLVRVEVECDADCKLDLDGKLQEFHSFFLEPGTEHELIATFETGSRQETVSGSAGETKILRFEAPPPPPQEAEAKPATTKQAAVTSPTDRETAPLPPVVTFIGAGVTAALLAGWIVSYLDMNAGVPEYEKAANAYKACLGAKDGDCGALYDTAQKELADGQGRTTRTFVLGAATGVAAVGTGVIALFLTDWSSEDGAESGVAFGVAPSPDGFVGALRGRF